MKKQIKDTVSKASTKQSDAKAATKQSDAKASASRKFFENKPVFIKYAGMAWNNYLEHLPAFANLSSKFTSKIAEDELKALKKLEKMVQDSDFSNLRADVYEDIETLKIVFKSGVWYIKEAFPGNLRKLEEAGVHESTSLNYLSREKLVSYTSSLKAFLTKYRKELAANDNMPVSFPKEFNNMANRLQSSLQNLNNAETSHSGMIQEMDALFAERHAAMFKMLKTATKVIFLDNKEIRNKFLMKNLKETVLVGEKTLLKGLVRLADDKMPIKNANVTIQGSPQYSIMTDKAGSFKLEVEKLGICKIKVKAPGYETFTTTKDIKEGVENRIRIYLTPLEDTKAEPSQPAPAPAKRSKKAAAEGVTA